MKVLVTGATGFIGAALCEALHAQGFSFVALSKQGAPLPDGSPSHAVNLSDSVALAKHLQGVTSVCHLAGIAHQNAAAQAYEQLNVQSSKLLAEAALAAGVKQFIYLSSVKAMGPAKVKTARSESMLSATVDAYGSSKYRAEQELKALCAKGDMGLVILRPSLVYGPSAKGNLRLLALAARWGLPRPPSGGARSMIGRDDLVKLILTLLEQPQEGQQLWIVSDGVNYSACDIYDAMRAALGRGPGLAWLPKPCWKLACTVLDLLRRQPVEGAYQKLFGTELYDSSAIQQSLAWRPQQRFADVAEEIVQSL